MPTQASCLRFVQGFYDWYVPLTKKRMNDPTFNVVLHNKPDVFNSDLLQALRVDSKASAHAKDDIVGLDFDPFIGSQDPANRYEARNATLLNNKCSVEIFGTSPTDKAVKLGKPDAIADVAFDSGHWKFVNFRYPDLKTDLLSVLKTLRDKRSISSQRSALNRVHRSAPGAKRSSLAARLSFGRISTTVYRRESVFVGLTGSVAR